MAADGSKQSLFCYIHSASSKSSNEDINVTLVDVIHINCFAATLHPLLK